MTIYKGRPFKSNKILVSLLTAAKDRTRFISSLSFRLINSNRVSHATFSVGDRSLIAYRLLDAAIKRSSYPRNYKLEQTNGNGINKAIHEFYPTSNYFPITW